MIHERKEDAGTDRPTGLWSIGAGITLGWDSDRGFNVGLGFSHEMDQGTMSGFGSSNMGYTWHEDGTRSVNMTSSGGVNLYGWNLYTGGGYSWNSEGGRVIGAYTGANYMGFAGGETGGSAYFDEDWDYQGYTVRQEFYGGAGGARVYSGYEWGFDGMEGRGAYGGASVLGANVEFAQNGGLSYGGSYMQKISSYERGKGYSHYSVLGGLIRGGSVELSSDAVFGYPNDDELYNITSAITDNDFDTWVVVSHGVEGMLLIKRPGQPAIYVTAQQFYDHYMSDPKSKYNGEHTIKLYACNAGKGGENSFAYQLHSIVHGKVLGPTHRISASWHRVYGGRTIAKWDHYCPKQLDHIAA